MGAGEDDLFKFKRAFFKGELKNFYVGKRIVDKASHNCLCELRGIASHSGDIGEINFFPEYRVG